MDILNREVVYWMIINILNMVEFTKSYAPGKVSHFLSILPRKKRVKRAFFHFYYVKVPLQKCLQLLQNKFKILFVFTNIAAKTIIYHYILWYNLEMKYFFCLMVFKNAKKTCHNTTPLPTVTPPALISTWIQPSKILQLSLRTFKTPLNWQTKAALSSRKNFDFSHSLCKLHYECIVWMSRVFIDTKDEWEMPSDAFSIAKIAAEEISS